MFGALSYFIHITYETVADVGFDLTLPAIVYGMLKDVFLWSQLINKPYDTTDKLGSHPWP